MRLARIKALVIKELLAVLRDRQSRTVLIFPPLLMLTVFSFAATMEVKNIELGVLDRDGGKAAVELVQRFTGSPSFTRVFRLAGQAAIAPTLEGEKAMAVLVIDADFSRDVAAGRPAQVHLLLDGRRSNAAQIVQGYAQTIVQRYNADLAERAQRNGPPATLVARNWFNPNLDYLWFTVPNLIGLLTMVIGLIVTALSVAREREMGTFDQLLVSPLSPLEILAGKTVPAMILGFFESQIIVTAAIFVFRIPCVGSLLSLFASLLLFLFSVVGFGLFISSLCNTQQQAILGTFTFMMPATLLSGFATPIECMPRFLQILSLADPLRHFLVAVRGIMLKGLPFLDVLGVIWPLAIIAVVTLTLANWFFRRGLR